MLGLQKAREKTEGWPAARGWVHLPPFEGENEVIACLELRADLSHSVFAAEGALIYFALSVLDRVSKMGQNSVGSEQGQDSAQTCPSLSPVVISPLVCHHKS